MEQQEILDKLKELIEAQIQISFIDPTKASHQEGMGLLMSQFFKWTGHPIVESCLYGLEDANFSTWMDEISKVTGVDPYSNEAT